MLSRAAFYCSEDGDKGLCPVVVLYCQTLNGCHGIPGAMQTSIGLLCEVQIEFCVARSSLIVAMFNK